MASCGVRRLQQAIQFEPSKPAAPDPAVVAPLVSNFRAVSELSASEYHTGCASIARAGCCEGGKHYRSGTNHSRRTSRSTSGVSVTVQIMVESSGDTVNRVSHCWIRSPSTPGNLPIFLAGPPKNGME